MNKSSLHFTGTRHAERMSLTDNTIKWPTFQDAWQEPKKEEQNVVSSIVRLAG